AHKFSSDTNLCLNSWGKKPKIIKKLEFEFLRSINYNLFCTENTYFHYKLKFENFFALHNEKAKKEKKKIQDLRDLTNSVNLVMNNCQLYFKEVYPMNSNYIPVELAAPVDGYKGFIDYNTSIIHEAENAAFKENYFLNINKRQLNVYPDALFNIAKKVKI
ncbi:hypothetical protein HK099_003230, partial [Clydaea vesicula]